MFKEEAIHVRDLAIQQQEQLDRRERELKTDANGEFVEGFLDVSYIRIEEDGTALLHDRVSLKHTFNEFSNRTLVSLLEEAIPNLTDVFEEVNVDACVSLDKELMEDPQNLEPYSEKGALVEQITKSGKRTKLPMISPIYHYGTLGMSALELVTTNPMQYVPELATMDYFCGVQVTDAPASPVFGLRLDTAEEMSDIALKVLDVPVASFASTISTDLLDLKPSEETTVTFIELLQKFQPSLLVYLYDGMVFNMKDIEPNYTMISAKKLLDELVESNPLVSFEELLRVVIEYKSTQNARKRLYANPQTLAKPLSFHETVRNRLYANHPIVAKLNSGLSTRQLREMTNAEIEKLYDIIGPPLLSAALASGAEVMYVFRGYIPYTVVCSAYFENNEAVHQLNIRDDNDVDDEFYVVDSENGKRKIEPTRDKHMVTMWFPVYIDLTKTKAPRLFKKGMFELDMNFYEKGTLALLTNAYEFPEIDMHYQEGNPHNTFVRGGPSFIAPKVRVYPTFTDTAPKRMRMHGRGEEQLLYTLWNYLSKTEEEFEEDMLENFPVVVPFHLASEKLVSVARNYRHISTGFRNGPIADFVQPDFNRDHWLNDFFEGRQSTVHGFEVSLDEFHQAHAIYKDIKRVITTPNYVAPSLRSINTESFRVAIIRGYSKAIRYVKSERDIPSEFLVRGSKQHEKRAKQQHNKRGFHFGRSSEKITNKMSSLHL